MAAAAATPPHLASTLPVVSPKLRPNLAPHINAHRGSDGIDVSQFWPSLSSHSAHPTANVVTAPQHRPLTAAVSATQVYLRRVSRRGGRRGWQQSRRPGAPLLLQKRAPSPAAARVPASALASARTPPRPKSRRARRYVTKYTCFLIQERERST